MAVQRREYWIPVSKTRLGLPRKPFLYTTDQIATLLAVELDRVKKWYLFYEGRHVGVCPDDKMRAINIAPDGEPADWRVEEIDFIRWLRRKGFVIYQRPF